MHCVPKLLHIIGDSKFGGGSKVILSVCRMVKSLGWHVDVLTTDKTLQSVLAEQEIGIVDIDVIRRKINPFRDLFGLVRLYNFLSASDYTIVHTHTSKGGFIGRLAAHRAKIKGIVHTVHGFAFHEQSPGQLIKLGAMIERRAANWCHRLTFVSNFHGEWAMNLGLAGPDKIITIPNGIPADMSPGLKSELPTSLGIDPDEILFLSTARLAPQKGLEQLIQAVAPLRKKLDVPFRLLVAGDGEFRDRLERTVKDSGLEKLVLFLGFQEKINDYLAAADIVVLPSLREGLSIALLEAMAAGKPIIAGNIGSNREATMNGEAAVLIDPDDSEALMQAMFELAVNERLKSQLSRKALTVFRSFYTEERMQMMYKKMYLDLLYECGYHADTKIGMDADCFQT